MDVYPREYEYMTYGSFTVDSTNAFSFDSTNLSPESGDFSGKKVQSVIMSVETTNIRYRLDEDSDEVSSSEGMLLKTTDSPVAIRGYGNISRLKIISTGANATLRVHFGYGGSSSKPV